MADDFDICNQCGDIVHREDCSILECCEGRICIWCMGDLNLKKPEETEENPERFVLNFICDMCRGHCPLCKKHKTA